jgi:hypothetical protein
MARSVQKSKKHAGGAQVAAGKSRSAATKSIKIDRDATYSPKAAPKTPTTYMLSNGLVDVDTVATAFMVTKGSLAQSLGFAEETLQRSARASAQKTQQRLREMLEILTRVAPWAGGMPQAMGWYRGQGIPALGDQTAEALVKNDQAAVVRTYLDAIATGAFA